MNKKILLIITAALGIAYYVIVNGTEEKPGRHKTVSTEAKALPQNYQQHLPASSPLRFKDALPSEDVQENSKRQMIRIVAKFLDSGLDRKGFLKEITQLGLNPVIYEEDDGLTDKMSTIRTKNTIPGVRYIHAEFTNDELQAIKFELPPSASGKEDAMDMIKKFIPLTENNKNETDETMISYRHEGHRIWTLELQKEDLIGHEYNAYGPSDAGTVQVGLMVDNHPIDHEH